MKDETDCVFDFTWVGVGFVIWGMNQCGKQGNGFLFLALWGLLI